MDNDNDRMRVSLLIQYVLTAAKARRWDYLDPAIDYAAELVGSRAEIDAWEEIHSYVDDFGGAEALKAAFASGDWGAAVRAASGGKELPPEVRAAVRLTGLDPEPETWHRPWV